VLARPADVIGRRVAGPVRSGEALTAARLIGAGLTAGLPPGLRATPVEVNGAGFLRAGDSVDLLVSDSPDTSATGPPVGSGSPTGSGLPAARILAEGARVLAVTPATAPPDADGTVVEIVVAVDRATSLRIAAVSGRTLVATVRNPP
jgi:Flp pilus assembly protein CpaB